MSKPLRVVYAGTPDFALASLRALVAAGHTPCAVLTQPDRPAGRGKQQTASPVKQFAGQMGGSHSLRRNANVSHHQAVHRPGTRQAQQPHLGIGKGHRHVSRQRDWIRLHCSVSSSFTRFRKTT